MDTSYRFSCYTWLWVSHGQCLGSLGLSLCATAVVVNISFRYTHEQCLKITNDRTEIQKPSSSYQQTAATAGCSETNQITQDLFELEFECDYKIRNAINDSNVNGVIETGFMRFDMPLSLSSCVRMHESDWLCIGLKCPFSFYDTYTQTRVGHFVGGEKTSMNGYNYRNSSPWDWLR